MKEYIEKLQIYNGFRLACTNLNENRELLNDINVFPVADRDTGSNMAMSMTEAFESLDDTMLPVILFEKVSETLLRTARGNSGTILTLFFQGVAETLKGTDNIDSVVFSEAFSRGAEKAFNGVLEPMDGTILTIAQKAAEKGRENRFCSPSELMCLMADEAYEALPLTAVQNPILAGAGVVDSGALGFIMIMDGFAAAFGGKDKVDKDYSDIKSRSDGFVQTELKYNYCTEFVIDNKGSGTADILREQLSDMGDCIIPAEKDGLLKVHIHTDRPEAVFFAASLCGKILSTKVDNMLAGGEGKQDSRMPVFLCREELTRDALLSMGYTGVYRSIQELTENLIDDGNVTLFTSENIKGAQADRFARIRYFAGDEVMLDYIYEEGE